MKTATAVQIDPANQAQLDAWDGGEGAYWAQHADYFDRSVAVHHERLMEAAAVDRDDRVLDIGCGTGQTTREAARAAANGHALGVDLSSNMLEIARTLAADDGLTNVAFEQADAQVHPFTAGSYDLAIGRTSAMFFADHVAAFTNIARALPKGGRVALTVWQGPEGNEWLREISGALDAGRGRPGPPIGVGPFALADPDRVRAVLGAAGFGNVTLASSVGPMWFGNDGADAAGFIGGLMGWMLEGLDDAGRAGAVAALRATCDAHESTDGVTFASAAWTITAVRS